jgi:hypothetical protein
MAISLADLTAEHFADLIGCGFRVVLPEHAETLTLERIEATRKSPNPAKFRNSFSLFFKGESKTAFINQNTVPMENDKLGRLDIFIVPIGRNDDGTFQYQAVFN